MNNEKDNIRQGKGEDTRIIKYSRTIYFASVGVLVAFMIISIILTYVLPKGRYEIVGGVIDYNNYVSMPEAGGINIFKGIFAPIMLFTADGFLQPLMMIIFLLTIAGVFQTMIDCGGMGAIVRRFVNKFKDKKNLFLALCSLFFMILGSCFGLFEETLLLLPMVITVCVGLGFDISVGFMVCTLATGIGFSVAITNPFTVVYSSALIGASVTKNIWYRLLIFALYYALLMGFIYLHNKSASKKAAEPVAKTQEEAAEPNDKKQFIVYLTFLLTAFVSVIVFSSVSALRDISLVLLIVVFLFGGIISGLIVCGAKKTFSTFGKGALSAMPSLVMIILAFAIKYILTEGQVIDTITHVIQLATVGKSEFVTVLIIFGVILVLEFFISSSTAKAVFVMGVLAGALNSHALAISKELVVLIYLFSDGFTNVLFPTSPVLLIGLSMTEQSYLGWLKRSKFFFPVVFALAIGLLALALVIGY